MKLDIIPTARDAADYSFHGTAAVIIDVLRATTSIQAILENGGRRVFPVANVDEAKGLKTRMPAALLCGERQGFPPDGFDMGNSPAAFSNTDLDCRDIILTTTNGTLAVLHAAGAAYLYSACILNASAAGTTIIKCREIDTAVLVCAGTEGSFSIEDFYAAGLVAAVVAEHASWTLTDIAWAALKLAKEPVHLVVNETTCKHLKTLIKKGFSEDITFALEGQGSSSLVPVYDRGQGCFYA